MKKVDEKIEELEKRLGKLNEKAENTEDFDVKQAVRQGAEKINKRINKLYGKR